MPFFLTLSRTICSTAVNHLAGRTVSQIFQTFMSFDAEHFGPVETAALDATAAPPVFDTEAVAQALMAQQAVTNEALNLILDEIMI